MNSRALMVVAAVLFGGLGLVATFAAPEIADLLHRAPGPHSAVAVQVAGGLYLGIAYLDWMARGMPIGGIYSRPLIIGNLVPNLVLGLALVRWLGDGHWLGLLGLLHGFLAAGFTILMVTPPRSPAGD